MDWLTFISHVISSLVWPVTVLLLALLFRVEVAAILPRIKGVKAGKVKVDLDVLKSAEREVASPRVPELVPVERAVPAAHRPAGIQREVINSELVAEVPVRTTPMNLAPADLMATSWQRLKRSLIQKAHAAGDVRVRSADSAVAYLVAKAKVKEGFEDAFDHVRLVYQRTRGQPADAALAREFAKACERLLEHLAETEV